MPYSFFLFYRLQRGVPIDAPPMQRTQTISLSHGHHTKCASITRPATKRSVFSATVGRAQTQRSRKAAFTTTDGLAIPAPNSQASAEDAAAADAASQASSSFTVDPDVASVSMKRTLNPQRGLSNSTFTTTARIPVAADKPPRSIPSGYRGHVQGAQFIIGKNYSSVSEAIMTYRDDAATPTKSTYQDLLG
jgi:hypothetical protein